jgi:hypothetical protein
VGQDVSISFIIKVSAAKSADVRESKHRTCTASGSARKTLPTRDESVSVTELMMTNY